MDSHDRGVGNSSLAAALQNARLSMRLRNLSLAKRKKHQGLPDIGHKRFRVKRKKKDDER